MTTLRLTPPADYVLARDACSYGYFLLEPNHWAPASHTFRTTMDLGGVAVTLRVTQRAPAGPEGEGERRTEERARHTYTSLRSHAGGELVVRADATLDAGHRAAVRRGLTRMLRLDEPAETVRAFHGVDRRFRRSGRGRLMRSASLFEDVIKTVTSCNVHWPSTIIMNARLCAVLGRKSATGLHAFPTAARLARARAATLRARCRTGYRDQRMIDLAKLFVKGAIDEAWLGDPVTPDADVFDFLLELPGIGPYAAANVMQLLGRYSRLPLDTESVRHGRAVLGYTGKSEQIMKVLHRHYAPMGDHKFRSYWFELWDFYEAKRGPSWTWERETTGKTFTASQLG